MHTSTFTFTATSTATNTPDGHNVLLQQENENRNEKVKKMQNTWWKVAKFAVHSRHWFTTSPDNWYKKDIFLGFKNLKNSEAHL